MNNMDQQVFIVDDEEDVRDSLKELVESIGIDACTFKNANEFLQAFNPDQSGCVLIDVRMPGMSGIDLQHKLKELEAGLPIIIITGHGDIPMAVQAMKEGAFEFLQKPFRDQDILDTITKALEKDRLNREKIKNAKNLQHRIESLTARERQVVDLVLDGKANKVIARELDISDRTIEIHRSHAMRKLGAHSVAELVKIMLSSQTD